MTTLKALILQNLPLPYPTFSYEGKIVIVTGSNIGLGLEASRHFTRLGAEKVILAVRNLEKGEAAKKSIENSTKRLNVVECWKLDMSSFAGVNQFIAKVQTLPRLDVLVLNAAVAVMSPRKSPDGWEESLQVNVLSTALLALRLLPKLVSSAKENPGWAPRLVIVSSEVHRLDVVASQVREFPPSTESTVFDFLNDEALSHIQGRYPLTKLFDVYIAREVARLSPPSDADPTKPAVIVNCLNPGLCFSGLAREMGWGFTVMQLFFARSTEKGSRTLVDASSKEEKSHGQYLSSCEIEELAPIVTSDEGKQAQKRVWGEILDILEPASPGIKQFAGL